LWQFQIVLYCILARSPQQSLPLNLLPTPLNTIARVSLFYFISVHEVYQPYTLTLISFIHPLPQVPSLHTTYFTILSFIMNILSQCSKWFLNVSFLWVYFTLICSTSSITLPSPFTSHPPFFNSFQYPYILYLHRWYVLQHCWCSVFLFSFPSFP
jgi:hypothetical protein